MTKQTDATNLLFFIGSINKPGPWFHPSGEGVSLFGFNCREGRIKRMAVFQEVENAIWLSPRNGGIFVATERFAEPGEISSFTFDGKNKLSQVGQAQSSEGGAVCHITLHPAEPVLFVSSYLGGLTVHAINQNNELAPAHQKIDYKEKSPHAMKATSNPHQATVSPDGKYLFVCDLGYDKIWMHGIDYTDRGIRLEPEQGVDIEVGSGPRHLIFHPRLPILYLLGQLNARVYVYAYEGGTLRLLARHHSLQEDFQGEAEGAAIKLHPSGKALYVSERYTNTITVFSIGEKGDLEKVSSFSTLGDKPRDFLISPGGDWMIVLNHDSDTLVPFSLDPQNGLPDGYAGDPFSVGCPVCGFFCSQLLINIEPRKRIFSD